MKHIGVYFIHGVSPSPQVQYLMSYQVDYPWNGNDMVTNSLGPNCIRSHRHFKSLFCVQDPRKNTPSRKTHPNWKIERLLKQVLRFSKEAMIPGRDASIDEQTIGFQGHHADKKRHNEKNKGDGFQCDSLNLLGGVHMGVLL